MAHSVFESTFLGQNSAQGLVCLGTLGVGLNGLAETADGKFGLSIAQGSMAKHQLDPGTGGKLQEVAGERIFEAYLYISTLGKLPTRVAESAEFTQRNSEGVAQGVGPGFQGQSPFEVLDGSVEGPFGRRRTAQTGMGCRGLWMFLQYLFKCLAGGFGIVPSEVDVAKSHAGREVSRSKLKGGQQSRKSFFNPTVVAQNGAQQIRPTKIIGA
jgi:hypothetical protein